jgi:subtilisin family serine protease
VNASLWWSNSDNLSLEAISYLRSKWWLIVAAAWNEWVNNEVYPTYPCNYNLDNVICVAATTEEWKLASFSNYWKSSVDVWAPWTSIYSTSVDESYNSPHNVDFTEISISDLNNWWNISWTHKYFPWYSYLTLISDGTYIQPKSPINVTSNDDLWIRVSTECKTTAWLSLEVDTWSWLKNIANYNTLDLTYIKIWKAYNGKVDYKLSLHNSDVWSCILYDITIQTLDDYTWPSIYEYMQWTSMATPHVAWLASLAWSFRPDLTYTGIIKAIITCTSAFSVYARKHLPIFVCITLVKNVFHWVGHKHHCICLGFHS